VPQVSLFSILSCGFVLASALCSFEVVLGIRGRKERFRRGELAKQQERQAGGM
jgi:hypothetical protein